MSPHCGAATMDTVGARMFARYAYPPNRLGYCGPVVPDLLLSCGTTGAIDTDLHGLAQEFDGAWTYLETLAELTGSDDPLDRRVVESYWLGGNLPLHIDRGVLGETLLRRLTQQGGRYWAHLNSDLLDAVAADHCFHVFAVYPWSRLLGPQHYEHPLRVLDNCRIRWGTVLALEGDDLVVRSRRLSWDGYRLGLSQPQVERVAHAVGGLSFLPGIAVGERVAMHWDYACDRLSDYQVAMLRAGTLTQIDATNRRLTPVAPPPSPSRESAIPAAAEPGAGRRRTPTVNDADWLAGHLRSTIAVRRSAWIGSEVTLGQLAALHVISAHAPVTLSFLARELGTGLPSTSAMVDRLIRAGLACRTRDRQDRRRVLLTTTRNCERMLGKIDPDTAARFQRALEGMSPAGLRCLSQVLRDITERF